MISVYVIKRQTSNKNYSGIAEVVTARLVEDNAGRIVKTLSENECEISNNIEMSIDRYIMKLLLVIT